MSKSVINRFSKSIWKKEEKKFKKLEKKVKIPDMSLNKVDSVILKEVKKRIANMK
jgi:hypothetical protein